MADRFESASLIRIAMVQAYPNMEKHANNHADSQDTKHQTNHTEDGAKRQYSPPAAVANSSLPPPPQNPPVDPPVHSEKCACPTAPRRLIDISYLNA